MTGGPVPALVQLKPGNAQPPVFMTHGLGGSAMDFLQIAKHIQTPRAMFGIQAKGIDGADEPQDRIEDMARFSLDAIRQVQPQGPYSLIGFSLGGLVTLEMAQQLIAQGETIGLLAMLDSYPHVSSLTGGQLIRLSARRNWRRVARRLGWLGINPPSETTAEVQHSRPLQKFRDASYVALERYRPQFYSGTIEFVRAAIPTDFPADPTAVWGHLAREFHLKTVPGDHLGMMTTHFESLASVVSDLIASAPE
ncbi:MAG: alpha/beta fold hydrolase [Terriglobales bacterium]